MLTHTCSGNESTRGTPDPHPTPSGSQLSTPYTPKETVTTPYTPKETVTTPYTLRETVTHTLYPWERQLAISLRASGYYRSSLYTNSLLTSFIIGFNEIKQRKLDLLFDHNQIMASNPLLRGVAVLWDRQSEILLLRIAKNCTMNTDKNWEADLADAPTKATFRSAFTMPSLTGVFTDVPFNLGLNCLIMSVVHRKEIVKITVTPESY